MIHVTLMDMDKTMTMKMDCDMVKLDNDTSNMDIVTMTPNMDGNIDGLGNDQCNMDMDGEMVT